MKRQLYSKPKAWLPCHRRWLTFECLEWRRVFAGDVCNAQVENLLNDIDSNGIQETSQHVMLASDQATDSQVVLDNRSSELSIGQRYLPISESAPFVLELPTFHDGMFGSDPGYRFVAITYPADLLSLHFDPSAIPSLSGDSWQQDAEFQSTRPRALPSERIEVSLSSSYPLNASLDVAQLNIGSGDDQLISANGLHAVITPAVPPSATTKGEPSPASAAIDNYATIIFKPEADGMITAYPMRGGRSQLDIVEQWHALQTLGPAPHDTSLDLADDFSTNDFGTGKMSEDQKGTTTHDRPSPPVEGGLSRNDPGRPGASRPSSGSVQPNSNHSTTNPAASSDTNRPVPLRTLDIGLGTGYRSAGSILLNSDSVSSSPKIVDAYSEHASNSQLSTQDVAYADSELRDTDADQAANSWFASDPAAGENERWAVKSATRIAMARLASTAFLISRVERDASPSSEFAQQKIPPLPEETSSSTGTVAGSTLPPHPNSNKSAGSVEADANIEPTASITIIPEEDLPPSPVALRQSATAAVVDRLAGSPLGLLMAIGGVAMIASRHGTECLMPRR